MANRKPSTTETIATPNVYQFKVYGTSGNKNRRSIILLGKVLSGKAEAGMLVSSPLLHAQWLITEVAELEFINNDESGDFVELVVACESEKEFKLLKSLRVYDEIINLSEVPKANVAE